MRPNIPQRHYELWRQRSKRSPETAAESLRQLLTVYEQEHQQRPDDGELAEQFATVLLESHPTTWSRFEGSAPDIETRSNTDRSE